MPEDPRSRDDNLMGRFDRQGLRRFSARDAVKAVLITIVLLVVFSGGSIRKAGEELNPGIGRDIVLAVGKPTGWIADRLPLAGIGHTLTGWLSPNSALTGVGFNDSALAAGKGGKTSPVTADWFDPAALGVPVKKRPLHSLLVTGDSLSTPLDLEMARRLAPDGVDVIRDPHLATGVSKSDVVDWGKLSASQVAEHHPDAVIVFIGANEGLPMPGPDGKDVSCCGPDWAAIWANRARQMMDNYRQGGAAKVYWLTVPTARDPARKPIVDAVDAAIVAAATPLRTQVRVLDTVPIFTPGDRYRDSMDVNGQQTIVRESDGIHLNETGSSVAANNVLRAVDADFTH